MDLLALATPTAHAEPSRQASTTLTIGVTVLPPPISRMVDLPKDIVTDTPFTVTCYGEQCPVVYVSEIITPQNGPAYREISIFY